MKRTFGNKILISLATIIVFALALVGCSSSDDDESQGTSLDFHFQSEDYPTYGEQTIIVDDLNNLQDLTLMTASFFENETGDKNGIKLITTDSDLTDTIHETVETGQNVDEYNQLMDAICYATSSFDPRTQFFIVDPVTNNNITIIQNGEVVDTLVK